MPNSAGKYLASELAETKWAFGDKNRDAVIAGSTSHSAQTLLRIEDLLIKQNSLLDSILSNLLMLGADGLHQVIRHHRRQVKKANAKARRPRPPRVPTTSTTT